MNLSRLLKKFGFPSTTSSLSHKSDRVNRIFVGTWIRIGLSWSAMIMGANLFAQNVSTSFEKNATAPQITSDAFSCNSCNYGVRVDIEGKEHNLMPSDGILNPRSVAEESEASPRGPVRIRSHRIDYPQQGVQLIYRIGSTSDGATLLIQVGLKNLRPSPIRLVSIVPIMAHFTLKDPSNRWWLTALNDSMHHSQPIHRFDEITQTIKVRECGSIYREDGKGFLFGPVGRPIAYVDAMISKTSPDSIELRYVADMSRVVVSPGQTRWGQQVALMTRPPTQALHDWATWVGQTHSARSKLGTLAGWNSWNFLGGKVSGNDIIAVVDACKKKPLQLRPQVIQIDGGIDLSRNSHETEKRFPLGLEHYAREISSIGARPGVLIDMNTGNLQVMDWPTAIDLASSYVRKGFRYIKLNTQNMSWAHLPASEKLTSLEYMRDGFSRMRHAVGQDTYLLNGDLRPNRAAVGYVDAQRIGAETRRENLRPAIEDTLRNLHYQSAWGAIDSDSYFLGTELENMSSISGGWPLVRTWLSMVGMSGGSAITSDPWYWETFRPHLRNVETMTPPDASPATTLDIGRGRDFARILKKSSENATHGVLALLWNPNSSERSISLDFREAGMNPQSRYAVWSFWDNRFLGLTKGSWSTPSLSPSASQHLRFTDLDATPNRPALIGSNLHISCGNTEIRRITSLQSGMEIELTDAGAVAGDLFIYSPLKPALKSATGCRIQQISYAGENVWRLSLSDRQLGEMQKLEVTIELPLTQLPWFWVMVALVTVSLLLAAVRYIKGLEIERAHALQQERSRIAQDLHDHIGANLAQIGLLTEQVEQALSDPDEMRAQLHQIFHVSDATARELDALVWAVDPSNDTLEEFARYVHGYAENYLAPAGIRCHFTNASLLPHLQLSSKIRHHLLMMIREALHNVIEHASAQLVECYIGIDGKDIVIDIEDDGVGMNKNASTNHGNGLQNMKHRAAEMKGRCDFHSNSSLRGTKVHIRIPINSSALPIPPLS